MLQVATIGMYDASCGVYLVTANRINAVGRLAGARTLLWHMRGSLSIIHTLAVAGPELCDMIGVPKFLDRYLPDVHEFPDPLSLFQHRRGWRARLYGTSRLWDEQLAVIRNGEVAHGSTEVRLLWKSM